MRITRSIVGTLGLLAFAGGFGALMDRQSGGASCSALIPTAVTQAKPTVKPKQPAKAQRKVIAYYFHGNYRCASCKTIEAWSASAIRDSFADDIKAGRLEWRVVNVEQPGKEHFTRDYRLYTKSVVLSDTRNGKETRWKNLDKVWTLLRDETGFRKYIRDEVSGYLHNS